jgi:mono/diheme cytochrome c family protein
MRTIWFSLAATAWAASVATSIAQQAPSVFQVSGRPPVDQAAHDRGRALWARECIDCHGSQARGAEKGPNIIRTKTVNFDRSAEVAGSVLEPFLRAGHPTMSGKASALFTREEVVALAHFLRQRVNDTMRSSPLFTAGDVLVGNRAAGEAYFNGAGGCAACHNAQARSLAGYGRRVPAPVDIQQRMMFPNTAPRGRGAGPNPNLIGVRVASSDGTILSGTLVEQSDFFVTVRLDNGTVRAVRRQPGMTVTLNNPLQAHIDLLDVITDAEMHDLVAYLEGLK